MSVYVTYIYIYKVYFLSSGYYSLSRSVHASNFAGIGVSVETAAKLFHIMDANQVWGVGCFGLPFFYTGLPRGAIF